MLIKIKYLFIEAIYINMCLSMIVNAYVLITEKDAIEELLKQMERPGYNVEIDEGINRYDRGHNPRDLKIQFVKKLIPHGLKRPLYEYDRKYHSIYKPLFQIRKTKHVNEIHKLPESSLKKYLDKVKFYKRNNEKLKNNYDSRYIFKENPTYVTNDKELSTETFKTESHKRKNDRMNYSLHRINNIAQKSIEDLLKRIQIENQMRRIFTKSTEVHDHLAPGAFTILHSHEIDKETTPNKRLPEYPFWNYWTYKKQIYHGECPMNTVKNQDGVCIRILPH